MEPNDLALVHIPQLLTMAGPARPRVREELADCGIIADAAILIRAGRIVAVGPTERIRREFSPQDFRIVNLKDRELVILPGFVDSHTHPAFWGTREEEYELRLRGVSYEEIAAKGGGILNSAKRVAQASQEQITGNILKYARLFLEQGTTTIEAKSGYGLSLEGELKLLRAIRAASGRTPLELVPTFLGAHAYPAEFRNHHQAYLDLLIGQMLPAVAAEGLARFCDVFCDRGFFSVEESRAILSAARELGLGLKIHADELAAIGAAELAAELGACSADHLERIPPKAIKALADRGVIASLLPGTAFNLGLEEYPPARRLIEAGVPVALATDFNPGTCFTPSLQLVVAIACCQLRLTPAEALSAATINGAWAIGLGRDRGSVEVGKKADLSIFACANYRQIPYLFGVNHCVETIKDGFPLRGLAFLEHARREVGPGLEA